MAINREELTKIIETEQGINWWKPELFEFKIKSILPRELSVAANPPLSEQNYNCFVYAFGLQNDPKFLGGNNPVQQEFVKWLILNNILIVKQKPTTGDLVFYKNERGEITHGGILQSASTVISKWMWGPIVIHKLMDVPASFGDTISFFKRPDTEEIRKQYFVYKDTGVEIKPIR